MAEGQSYLELIGNALKHPFGVSSAVPSSRSIISASTSYLTVNGGSSATLGAGDVTLAIVVSGGGSGVVGVGRTIATTSPLRIDAGASANLSSNRTLSILTFGAANAGVVPQTGGVGAGYFLEATGSWTLGAVSGVSSITGTAPIVASAATGAVTLSISPANLTTPGSVPAVGSVDASYFLCRTNPPAWAQPGAGAFLTLQASYPGTADVGNAHITGVLGAQTALVAGSDKKSKNGTGLENLYVKQSGPVNHPVIASYYALGGTIGPGVIFQASRGSEASPADISSGDVIGRLISEQRVAGGWYQNEFMEIIGKSSGGYSLTLRANGSPLVSLAQSYLHLSANALAGLNTLTPVSGFEVGTSFGLKTLSCTGTSPSISSTFETDCIYLCDATASGSVQLPILQTAAGRAGRIYGAIKIDATIKPVLLTVTGGGLINGQTSYQLNRRGDCVLLISDGTNYQILSAYTGYDRQTNTADGSALANSAAETTLYDFGALVVQSFPGQVAGMRAYGKFSTTGTPTLRFKVKNANNEILVDSGAVTMPNGVTDAVWQLTYESAGRATVATQRQLQGKLFISQAAGTGAEMKVYNMVDLAIGALTAGGTPRLITGQWGTANPSNSVTLLELVRSQSDSTTLT